MNILVTGCAGFIGSTVVSQLLDLGRTVLGVDSLSNSPGNPSKDGGSTRSCGAQVSPSNAWTSPTLTN